MSINRYSYQELSKKALSDSATQEDVNNLGQWFDLYGMDFWNGKCFSIDSEHDLYPIYAPADNDQYDIIGYEIRNS